MLVKLHQARKLSDGKCIVLFIYIVLERWIITPDSWSRRANTRPSPTRPKVAGPRKLPGWLATSSTTGTWRRSRSKTSSAHWARKELWSSSVSIPHSQEFRSVCFWSSFRVIYIYKKWIYLNAKNIKIFFQARLIRISTDRLWSSRLRLARVSHSFISAIDCQKFTSVLKSLFL